MKVALVPSSVSERTENQHQFLSSYIINDTLAIDAGCLGFHGTAQEQALIKDVLITHTHIDHIGSLPIFVENAFDGRPDCVTIHGSDDVLDCLHKDVFNNRLWPDFISMSNEKTPFLKLARLQSNTPVMVQGLRITPVLVNHVVPTMGFIIEDSSGAVVIVSDTGPTEAIWERANATNNVKAVFLEATFPNNLGWLADVSKHLTPALFSKEIVKLKAPATIIAVHVKARFLAEVLPELKALGNPKLEIGQFGRPYIF